MTPATMRLTGATLAGAFLLAATAAQAASVEEGRRLAELNCARCHAIGVDGTSPNPRAPLLRDIYKRYPMGRVEEQLREGMLTRHRSMPRMRFSDGQLADLAAYLRSIQLPSRQPPQI